MASNVTAPSREMTRDETLAARKGFSLGVEAMFISVEIPSNPQVVAEYLRIKDTAPQYFPLPKISRTRIVRDSNGICWKFEGGQLRFRSCPFEEAKRYEGQWGHGEHGMFLTRERITLLCDLISSPTELVEDEG